MSLVPLPDWWEQYIQLAGENARFEPITGPGGVVVFNPTDESGLNPVQNAYIGNNYALPTSQIQELAVIGNTALPADPVNIITAAIDSDPGGALGRLLAYRMAVYGLPANKLGDVRNSSAVLVQERTGIRPGVLPRIVLPVWARNDRGGPF